MSYSVYATTASRFIKRFYESLAEHRTLAEAVAAARLKLFTDAAQLAKKVLQTVDRTPEDFRNDPDYSRLITLLNGHARSIEVVLPQLEKKRPAEIIEALQ